MSYAIESRFHNDAADTIIISNAHGGVDITAADWLGGLLTLIIGRQAP